MLVAIDGKAAGLIAVADPIKQSAIGALQALRGERIRVVMLTGDSRTTAAAVGRKLGADPESAAGVARRSSASRSGRRS